LILAVTLYAWYGKKLAGSWRWIYVATAIAALYLNVFVLVVQAFLKVEPLKALAPRQNEPPFVAAQAVVLIALVALGVVAAKRFRPTLHA
jgi:fatty acid desaturase